MRSQRIEEKIPACRLHAEKPKTGQICLTLVGINHQTSTLKEREPLQLGRDELPLVDNLLMAPKDMREAAAVCTCNRIEFYLVLRDTADPFAVVAGAYRKHRNLDLAPLREKFYLRTEANAVHHLLLVAAGLSSMVLGETQIFGQIKQGYSQACSVKSAGKILHRLFHQAFRTGKKVREETAIGRGAVSVGGIAARMVNERMSKDANPLIVFVGVNDMISLAAEHLHSNGYRNFAFANRTLEHAAPLARVYRAACQPLTALDILLESAAVVITCTGAETPIITRPLVQTARAASTKPTLLLMDLGVPRDVETEAGELAGVTVVDLDVMNRELTSRLEERASAINPAQDIVEQKLSEFMYWYEPVRQEPMYNGLAETFEQARCAELAAGGEHVSSEFRETLDQFSLRLVRRLLQAVSRRSE